ncbi:NAD(P)-dependent oxidoreductase [Dyadobacter sp. CY326]|uniref:NAD-dependent epimerase/dehydratase family protein n=1 Tax=Dyadobacter sp. CY326 TaxID=2907300 RepID=UPI001F23B4FD|nr:SDR family oxidoreductase [Dyadobacter sp. CY326]MCE7065379.1 SDR family oxidoreductase [Dyadobacter sp. CY326]
MKVLVIGSKGFIGSHLCDFFQSLPGYEVFESDVMVDYEKTNYFLVDATNSDFQKVFRDYQFDACINCSGAASVPDSLKNPMRDFTLNTLNVYKILDAIRANQPICKFINFSSAAVYGNPLSLPIQEQLALAPISPYGIHKMQAEEICKIFHTYYQIPTCSLRVFSAYGPGLKKQLFWDICKKAGQTDEIEMFGTGEESRDFIYIDDLVAAVQCCLSDAKFQGEAINIANGEEIKISHAVEMLLHFFPDKKKAKFNGLIKTGDPVNWRADITLLRSMGYNKSTTLEHGLKNYYQWISQQH